MALHDIQWKKQLEALLADTESLVLVDFWAEWCGPCKMLSPVLETIAQDNPDIDIAKVNVDHPDNNDLAQDYSVRSIPQVTFMKNWEKVDQFVWALPPNQINEYIEKHK